MDPSLIKALLLAVAATLTFYALFYNRMAASEAAGKRKAQFQQKKVRSDGDRANDAGRRRQQIADTLKDLENGQRGKKARTIDGMIEQAGLNIEKRTFFIASAGSAAVFGLLAFTIGKGNLYATAGLILAGGLGFPRFVLSFLAKRRLKKFLAEFPGAVDVIIRGVKAGLPIGQTLGIIAREAAEPVRGEFRRIVEAQAIGMTVSEAVEILPERVPLPETSFFSIVVTLQQKSGGNLSEALGNLSRVLRDRKKMRQKIQAMSSEAKASAGIIGALPFVVAGLVYLTSPDYIMLLFTNTSGHMVLGVCAFWMCAGIFIMRKMINFDF